jgi:hypothetical protein
VLEPVELGVERRVEVEAKRFDMEAFARRYGGNAMEEDGEAARCLGRTCEVEIEW